MTNRDREYNREYMRKWRAKRLGKPLQLGNEPSNINEGMKLTREEPMTWDEYQKENLVSSKTDWIKYKLEFFQKHKYKDQIERAKNERSSEESLKYGTHQHDCILCRRAIEAGRRGPFIYNHLDNCKPCCAWYARQKDRSSLDLNDTKGKSQSFEELKGYEEAFREPKPYPEDYVYSNDGVFPMTKICSICGTPTTPKGNCPVCDP